MSLLTWTQLLWATVGLIAILAVGALALGACRRTLLRDLARGASRRAGGAGGGLDPWAESAARLASRADPPPRAQE